MSQVPTLLQWGETSLWTKQKCLFSAIWYEWYKKCKTSRYISI